MTAVAGLLKQALLLVLVWRAGLSMLVGLGDAPREYLCGLVSNPLCLSPVGTEMGGEGWRCSCNIAQQAYFRMLPADPTDIADRQLSCNIVL